MVYLTKLSCRSKLIEPYKPTSRDCDYPEDVTCHLLVTSLYVCTYRLPGQHIGVRSEVLPVATQPGMESCLGNVVLPSLPSSTAAHCCMWSNIRHIEDSTNET